MNRMTTQLTGPLGLAAAATSPPIPRPTIVAGTRPAAAADTQSARISASTTAASVHTLTPNSTTLIAATGTSSAPGPSCRSSLVSVLHMSLTRIRIRPIVDPGPPASPWGGT